MDGFFVWDVSPSIYQLWKLDLRWYSLMFVIGFVSGYFIVMKMFRDEGHNVALVGSLLNYLIIGTIVGARLGHCLLYDPVFYLSNPWELLFIWKGGLASHGGFTGVIIAAFLFCRRYKFSLLWLMDKLAVNALLVGSLIRIGNFINSEILGTPSQLPWAVVFARRDNIPRHPAQLYESLTYMCVFALLAFLYWRTDIRKIPGRLWGVAMAVAFTARFMLEFVKIPQEGFEQGMLLNMGQILSVPFVSFGLVLIFRKPKTTAPQS